MLIENKKPKTNVLNYKNALLTPDSEVEFKDHITEKTNDKKIKMIKKMFKSHVKWESTLKINDKPYVVPQYCQTCQKKYPWDRWEHGDKGYETSYSFCSLNCFNTASLGHYGGAVLPVQIFHGKPCAILIKDGTRGKQCIEIPGGKKKEFEGPGKTAAREATEELGLKNPISHRYLEANSLRLLSWYQKSNGTRCNYTVFITPFEKFNVNDSNKAISSRKKDKGRFPGWRDWKETEQIYIVPIENLEKYSNGIEQHIYDFQGNQLDKPSERWIKFFKSSQAIKTLHNVIFSDIETWKVVLRDQPQSDAFVYSHNDVPFFKELELNRQNS